MESNNSSSVSKIMGIKTKLIGAFLLPVFLFIVVGMIIYGISEQGLKENSEILTYTSVDVIREYCELGFNSIELAATRIAVNKSVNTHFGGNFDSSAGYELEARGVIVTESVADRYIQSILAFSKNQPVSISSSGLVKKPELYQTFVDSENGQYVKENMDGGTIWISRHPEVDELMDFKEEDYILSYVRVLRDNNNRQTGYMFIDVKTSFIKNILDSADVGDNSIIGFITSDGKEVISGSDSFRFTGKKFFNKIADKDRGYKYVKYNGESYLFLYDRVQNGDGIVCAMVPRKVIIEKAYDIRLYTIVAILICCLIAVIVGSILATGIAKAINRVNSVMRQTAEGDLTGTIETKRNDEFKLLSKNITNMITSIKELVLKMRGVSEQVQHSSGKVNENSEVLYRATRDITQSIEDIEQGLIQQSADTESCLVQMSGLAEKISMVYSSTNQIEKIASKTQDTVDSGMVIVTELEERVKDTTMITKDIIQDISELERESKAINSIILTINDIADETNLLSLNASIEAARAGEAGKGFAVVSEEIRKLAEQSSEAGTQIGEIIARIQARMGKTIETARRAENIVSYQSDALGDTVNVFEDIKGHVNTLATDLDTISDNIQLIALAKEDTLEAIASISATSNETEAASSELSKNAERQMQAVQLLYDEVKLLEKNSADLEEAIRLFKVKESRKINTNMKSDDNSHLEENRSSEEPLPSEEAETVEELTQPEADLQAEKLTQPEADLQPEDLWQPEEESPSENTWQPEDLTGVDENVDVAENALKPEDLEVTGHETLEEFLKKNESASKEEIEEFLQKRDAALEAAEQENLRKKEQEKNKTLNDFMNEKKSKKKKKTHK